MTHEPDPAAPLIQGPRQALTGADEVSAISAVRDDLRALQAVVEGTARRTGQDFFQSLGR